MSLFTLSTLPGTQCLSPWNVQNELHLWPPEKPRPKVFGAILVSISILKDIVMLIISPKTGQDTGRALGFTSGQSWTPNFPLTSLCGMRGASGIRVLATTMAESELLRLGRVNTHLQMNVVIVLHPTPFTVLILAIRRVLGGELWR